MQRSLLCLIGLLMLVSCLNPDKVQVVTIRDKYTLPLPAFLKEVTNLHEEASLQYQHAMKEFYVVVFDEPKSDLHQSLEDNGLNSQYSSDLDGYAAILIDGMDDALSITKKSQVIDTFVNAMPARMIQFHGSVDGISLFYSIAYVEGKETYYNITTWTLAEKEEKNKEKMDQILYTLKEL